MKQQEKQEQIDGEHVELVKAAAQAWLAHSSNPKSNRKESDERKGGFTSQPSRFQVEAAKLRKQREQEADDVWNFSRSLWDPYEIVAVSKRLEVGLQLEHVPAVPFVSPAEPSRTTKSGKKGSSGLRKLLRSSFSRRIIPG